VLDAKANLNELRALKALKGQQRRVASLDVIAPTVAAGWGTSGSNSNSSSEPPQNTATKTTRNTASSAANVQDSNTTASMQDSGSGATAPPIAPEQLAMLARQLVLGPGATAAAQPQPQPQPLPQPQPQPPQPHPQLRAELEALRDQKASDMDEICALRMRLLKSECDKQELQSELRASVNRDDDAGRCVVCMDAPKSYAVIPCGHHALCAGCAGPSIVKHCPVCRAPTNGVLRIFSA